MTSKLAIQSTRPAAIAELDRCTTLSEAGVSASEAWLRLELSSARDGAARRRQWLVVVNELLALEAELERDTCECPRCLITREGANQLRSWLEQLAELTGLPLPMYGEGVRLPVNVDVLEGRAARLVANRAVTALGQGDYLVYTSGGRHGVHAGRAAHWETDWTCTCAWAQPYPPDGRAGRGCTHVRAVRMYRALRAGALPSVDTAPTVATLAQSALP